MTLQAVRCLLNKSARKHEAGAAQVVSKSTRRGPSRVSAAAVWCLLLVASATWLPAQTVTLKTFGSDPYDSFSNLIQASDGNLYAVSDRFGGSSTANSCPDGSANECGFITRITPDGTVTILHTFERDGQTGVSDGYGPSSLIEAPDGMLYGTTIEGGSSGYGTIFKVSVLGVFTTLYTFPADGTGNDPTALSPGAHNGTSPGPLVLGNDGNFYGTSQGTGGGFGFFQLSPTGTFTMLHPPDKAEYQYDFINPLLQADDGNFYATTGINIVQITPQGAVRTIYPFPLDGSGGAGHGVLVEGADQNLYGTSEFSGYDSSGMENGEGVVYKIAPAGAYRELYRFTGGIDGFNVNSELTVGTDGSFYGTTYYGGNTLQCNDSGPGCGTVFKVSPTTGFSSLYAFSQTATDGQRPYGRMLQGSDGNFIGSFNSDAPTSNSAFKLSILPALPAPVQLSFSNTTISPNQPLVLTWKVLNAFSATMQQCHASIQNTAPGAGAGAGMWAGPQTGTMMGAVYTGNSTITPTAPGTYTYALNCGGVETGSVTLIVGNGPTIVTSSLPNAAVGKTYRSLIQTVGGTQPYHYSTLGDVPPGLTIDGNLGVLSGTPKQFGDYKFGVYVQDSANPPLDNTATFTLTVDSTLALSSTLPNPTLNAPYNASLPATGGYGGYKFVLAAGKLPVGLTLNATTGILSGTATVAGKYTFTITLTDGEDPMDEVTQVFNVSTVIPPLAVEGGGVFPSCTVEVLCEGQFTATGGVPPYTWAIAPGTKFPAGLTLDPDGGFTGKPLQMNSLLPEDLEVQVTDSENPPVMNSGTNQLSIASGLKVVSVDLPQATVGMAYAAPPPVATGGLPPYTWVIQPFNPEIIPEYSADPKTGALKSLGPLTPGSFYFNYTVIDSETHPAYASNKSDVILVVVEPPLPTATVLSSSNSAAGTGMTVTLTAKVSKTGAVPTGVVVFYSGTAALGTATLDATGSASLQTSFSTPGTFSLTAAYSGDGASAGSVSTPLAETVVTPTVSASLAPSTLTLTSGQSGTILITLTPAGGYTGTVAFSCGQLPAHVSCAFAPSSVIIAPGATSVTDTLTINTAAPTLAALEMPAGANGGSVFAALTLWLPASMLALFGLRRKAAPLPRLLAVCLFTLSLAGALTLTGCGSTSPNIKAAPGTYSIPITLTLSGGVTNSLTATVVVQ